MNKDLSLCLPFKCGITCNYKDVLGWQFLTTEAAEIPGMVCLSPEEHIFRKEHLGNRPFKKLNFIWV